MGFFGNEKNVVMTPRENLESKYNGARANLLFVVAFSLINIVLLVAKSGSYFLFSASVPYELVVFGMLLCGKLPEEYYTDWMEETEFLDSSFLVVMLVIAAVILFLYLLCWVYSKKRVGWLITALVFFSIDTAVMLLLGGISIDTIIDIAFHIWVIVSLASGIGAYKKLKELPEEEFFENPEEAAPETNEE